MGIFRKLAKKALRGKIIKELDMQEQLVKEALEGLDKENFSKAKSAVRRIVELSRLEYRNFVKLKNREQEKEIIDLIKRARNIEISIRKAEKIKEALLAEKYPKQKKYLEEIYLEEISKIKGYLKNIKKNIPDVKMAA